jgi:hypothetical protein
MAASGLAIPFGALIAGAVILEYGVKNARAAFSSASSGGTVGQPASAVRAENAGVPTTIGKFPAAVDPLPDSVGSRLDQGIDGTGKTFLSPWAGKVVYSSPSDSGWKGGGYIAIQARNDASKVYYLAEGITPILHVGDSVTAGQRIAYPVSNPYNGIVGNFEAGLANPAAPGQPLAQVVSNASGMVDEFYAWLHALGGPTATSTASAGHG